MILSRQSIEDTIEAVKLQIDGLEQDRKDIEQEIESSSAEAQKIEDDQIRELLHEIGVALNHSHGVLRSFQEALKSYLVQQDLEGKRLRFPKEKISLFEFYGFNISDIEEVVDDEHTLQITDEKEITWEEQISGDDSLSLVGSNTLANEEIQDTAENEKGCEATQFQNQDSNVEGKKGREGDGQKQMASMENKTNSEPNSENQERQQLTNITLEEFASENPRISSSFQKDTKIDGVEGRIIGTPPKNVQANDGSQRPRISISASIPSPRNSECITSPKTQSPIRLRMSPKSSFFGKEGANMMRDILEEMKREASSIQSQFRETYMTERNKLLEDLSHTKILLQQKQLQEVEMKRKQEEYKEENDKIREQLQKREAELETLYSELQTQTSK